METIIGLLFILLPVIFKAIGNKLEKSGKLGPAGKMHDIAKALGADDQPAVETEKEDDFDSFFKELFAEEKPEDTDEPVLVEPVAVPENVVERTTVKPKPKAAKPTVVPVRQEAEEKASLKMYEKKKPEKKSEKIDPKKLVIYSEIMKPKF